MTHEQAIEYLDRRLDGELDQSLRLEVERHAAACPICMALVQSREALSAAVARTELYYHAPAAMKDRVMARVAPSPRWRFIPVRFIQERLVTGGFSTARLLKRWAGLGAAAAVIALAIASSLAWLAPLPGGDPMYQYVVDSFKHSQSNGGVVDLAASRGSTIGAWLKGRINPPVPIQDISSSTVVLSGVRLDQLGEQNVAVLVYRVGATEIDLFEWSDAQVHPSEPMIDQIGAYTVAYWSSDGTHFWAVTATHDKSVVDLRDVVQRLTAPATTAPVTTP